MPKKEKQIVIRMDEKMHAALTELAKKDNRFLSDFVRVYLQKLLKTNQL